MNTHTLSFQKRLPRQRSATASSNMTLSSVPPSRTARAESVARAESIARSQTPTELEQVYKLGLIALM